jgi:hypothetical protein
VRVGHHLDDAQRGAQRHDRVGAGGDLTDHQGEPGRDLHQDVTLGGVGLVERGDQQLAGANETGDDLPRILSPGMRILSAGM